MEQINVKIKKLIPEAVIPTYAHNGDAGMDITAISVEYNKEYKCWVYHTGLAFAVPKGYAMFLFPRSSNRKTSCYMTNHVGVLDSGYRGELLICFKERHKMDDGITPPYKVRDRIAQLIILPYPYIKFLETDTLDKTERGENGHGSTGN